MSTHQSAVYLLLAETILWNSAVPIRPITQATFPSQSTQTKESLKLIADMRRRNYEAGLVVFWVKLWQRGYKLFITGLYRILRKQGNMAVKPPNPKYIRKSYETTYYPYTAIDEYSRFRYLEAFEQASTYTYTLFLEHMLKTFKFEIEFVQSDNSFEFTKRFGGDKNPPTLF